MVNDKKLESILKKHNGSWADVLMDIGKNVRHSGERMDLYIEALGKVAGDVSAVNTLYSEMKYARIEMAEHEKELMIINLGMVNYMKELKDMTIIDSLTGLFNRGFFDVTLNKTIAKAKRQGESVSLIIADIDHFKLFNDNYGHLVGDKVLTTTSNILKNGVRESDVVCRYGGEEFGIILSNTNWEDALGVAYKLNRKVANCPIGFKNGSKKMYDVSVNISVGVDQFKENDSVKGLIGRVDGFLYEAKNIGRNCVVGQEGVYIPTN